MSDSETGHLAGKLLLAMPGLGDPRFYHAVILICAHDTNGAMGLVINNILPGLRLSELLLQLNIIDRPESGPDKEIPVLGGGPVESNRGFIVHGRDFSVAESIAITDDIAVTGTIDALRKIIGEECPRDIMFVLGYAGWTAGQLEQEIQENAWLILDADPQLVFSVPSDEKWLHAVRKLGIDPAMLSMDAGRA